MNAPVKPSTKTMLCSACSKVLNDVAGRRCPACGREFDPSDETTFTWALDPSSPHLAVLPGLLVLCAPLIGICAIGLGMVLRAFGIFLDAYGFAARCFAFSPLICIPGIFLAHIAGRRYKKRGQTVCLAVTDLSLVVGYVLTLSIILFGWVPGLVLVVLYR